jgi:hypothetical protein
MTGMLHGLLRALADEIRVRLPEGLVDSCETEPDELVSDLRKAGLLALPRLVALLLRRADRASFEAAPAERSSPVQQWTADEVPAIAAAAMTVVLARAASRDRFGRPGLELSDCDAEVAVELSYSVAAALSARAPDGSGEEFVAAAVDLLSRHDEGQRLEALEARLILALEADGRLDGALLRQLASAGEVSLLAEALGRMAGIPGDAAWEMVVGSEEGRFAMLGHLAGQPRDVLGALLAAVNRRTNSATEMDAFDAIGPEAVAAEHARLRQPPAFRAAVEALGGHG